MAMAAVNSGRPLNPGRSLAMRVDPNDLFHVSDRSDIARFEPRVAPTDPDGRLAVWAIDGDHLGHLLLPRDCPRVYFRADAASTAADVDRLLHGDRTGRVVAVEHGWWRRIADARMTVYRMPPTQFALHDATAGYHIAEGTVIPTAAMTVDDVPAAVLALGYELRVMPSLWWLRDVVVASTLPFSVIRWRHAAPRPGRVTTP